MVMPYLPIAATVVALNAASSFAAPLRHFEPQEFSIPDHHPAAGRNLQDAVVPDRLKDSNNVPARPVLNQRSVAPGEGYGPSLIRSSSANSYFATHSSPNRISSASSYFSAHGTLHNAPPASQDILVDPNSTRGHSPQTQSPVEPPAEEKQSTPAEKKQSTPAKKQSRLSVYRQGAIKELKVNPIRTGFGIVATTFGAAALAHAFSHRDIDELQDSLYGRELMLD